MYICLMKVEDGNDAFPSADLPYIFLNLLFMYSNAKGRFHM